MKNWKLSLLRIVCNIIVVCVICTSGSFAVYWIVKEFSDFRSSILDWLVFFNVFGLLILFFSMIFNLIERGTDKWLDWVSPKLQRYELGTRYILRKFLTRIGIILMTSAVLFMILMQATGAEPFPCTFVPLFSGPLLGLFGSTLISEKDISLIHLKNFRTEKRKYFKNLNLGLKKYNSAVGFRFQSKKLYAITQYAKHIYNLRLKEEIKQLETNLDKIIQALENNDLSEIPKTLTELSKNSDSFTKEYGIPIKPRLWPRTKEAIASSFHKALPQLIWLLCVIVIFLFLRMFIPIEMSIP